jgi:hypothetical protein
MALAGAMALWAPLGASAQIALGGGRIGAPALPHERVAVFGADDRTALGREPHGLKGRVGVLYSPRSRTMCTAFCVADDVIATAAHCLFRTAGEPLPPVEDFRFNRGKDSNTGTSSRIAGFGTRSSLQNVISGSSSLSVRPPIDATRDWALARLAAPVCRGNILELAPQAPAALDRAAAAGKLFLVGYHRDFADWRVAISRDCEVKRMGQDPEGEGFRRDFIDHNKLILHTCDTGGASSGSPLLMQTATGPVVVGINVGTYVQSKVMVQNGEVVHRFKAAEIANTAADISAAAQMLPVLQHTPVLASGSRQVRELQRLLKMLDVYPGPVDGVYGPMLRIAIEQHERRQRLPVTGLPTPSLLQQLGHQAPVIETGTIHSR